jgi:hypothetical protein
MYTDERYDPFCLNKTNQINIYKRAVFGMVSTSAAYLAERGNNPADFGHLVLKDPYLCHRIDTLPDFFGNNFRIAAIIRDPRGAVSSLRAVRARQGANPCVENLCLELRPFYDSLLSSDLIQNGAWCHLMRYEDLVQMPEETLNNLENFLGFALDRTGENSLKTIADKRDPFYTPHYNREINSQSLESSRTALSSTEQKIVLDSFSDIMRSYYPQEERS